jgi:nucleotide-binding universal stress UspA family protein
MKNIIIAVDFVEDNEILLEKSIEIIKKFQAKIWIIHIAAPEPDFVGYAANSKSERKFIADKLREEHKKVQEISKGFKNFGFDSEALLISGPTVDTLVEQSKKLNADMIIIGFHKRGFLSAIFGDITIGVLKKIGIPLLSIPTH